MRVSIPKVTIDTSAIKAIGKEVFGKAREGERLKLSLELCNYKIKTAPILGSPRELPAEDHVVVAKLVRQMNANGWLKDEDIMWCRENHIPIV